MDCKFCFYRVWPLTDWDENEMMSTETALRVLKELKELDVKAIEWTGGGSIETHPDWKLILYEASRMGFKQALVTNGTFLDDRAMEILRNFEWVRFSIDAATKSTYRKNFRYTPYCWCRYRSTITRCSSC